MKWFATVLTTFPKNIKTKMTKPHADIQAIVFDFDGVIVDSEPLHYQAIHDTAQSFGGPFSYDDYLVELVGFDDRDAFRYLMKKAGLQADEIEAKLPELCTQKQAMFDAIVERGQFKAVSGVLDLIDELKASDVPRAIASGATQQDIDLMLKGLNRRDAFEIIVAADDVAHSKPDPQTYRLAVEKLGLLPEQCLAIEDTPAGLKSAKYAGLRTLGLTTTTSADQLVDAEHVRDHLQGFLWKDLVALMRVANV